jgi:hypothetical protein
LSGQRNDIHIVKPPGENSMNFPAKFYLFIILSFALVTNSSAADHFDAPLTSADPIADLADTYAFINPNDTQELIIILTVNPFANTGSKFSDAVQYKVLLENATGVDFEIACSATTEQIISCNGPGNQQVSGLVGQTHVNGEMRLYAGLRDDPFFFDLAAFNETIATASVAFTNPGVDALAGSNVLAIVLGINIDVLVPDSSNLDNFNMKLWSSTQRIAGAGIGGGISGSWWNAQQDGQGWILEAVNNRADGSTPSNTNAVEQFVMYFFSYAQGNQLWLVGNGSNINGNNASVDVMRTSGANFGTDFDPNSVQRETVGTMNFSFTTCNSGHVDFVPLPSSGLNAFSTDIERLTSISGLNCNLFASGQIDREGRPAVNTALIPKDKKDSYNRAEIPADWASLFTADISDSILFVDGLDGIMGNFLTGNVAALAGVLADDRIQINLNIPNCGAYLAIEAAGITGTTATACGGRTLDADVIDDTLTVLVSGGAIPVSDGVDANDKAFLNVFPFLAAPH